MIRASYAQNGEDRIIAQLLRRMGGPLNRVAVEFGAKDGIFKSNTAMLREKGWQVFLFDQYPESPIVQEALITRENVNDVFAAAGVPHAFDVLSIDVDGNDLWIWDALTYEPRIVVIEFNPGFPNHVSATVPYDPNRSWDGTNYYGASLLALYRLARRKRYRLVRYTRSNLIFVQKGLMPDRLYPVQVRLPKIATKPEDPFGRPWLNFR